MTLKFVARFVLYCLPKTILNDIGWVQLENEKKIYNTNVKLYNVSTY